MFKNWVHTRTWTVKFKTWSEFVVPQGWRNLNPFCFASTHFLKMVSDFFSSLLHECILNEWFSDSKLSTTSLLSFFNYQNCYFALKWPSSFASSLVLRPLPDRQNLLECDDLQGGQNGCFFFSKVDISWPDMFSFRHVSAFFVCIWFAYLCIQVDLFHIYSSIHH